MFVTYGFTIFCACRTWSYLLYQEKEAATDIRSTCLFTANAHAPSSSSRLAISMRRRGDGSATGGQHFGHGQMAMRRLLRKRRSFSLRCSLCLHIASSLSTEPSTAGENRSRCRGQACHPRYRSLCYIVGTSFLLLVDPPTAPPME